jgi:hypothetical protein
VTFLCHTYRRLALAAALLACLAASPSRAQQPQLGSLLFVPPDIYNAFGENAPAVNAAAADNAFEQARQAVADGRVSDAFRHACAAVALNADQADARRLLGYQRVGEHWAGGYAQGMLQEGNVWTPEFGWLRDDHVAKYELGLRPARGRWVTPEADARLHAKIERGWTVRTDHFLITTNIDRAAGVELATRLESLFQLWRQLFGDFAATPEELQARLDGKETSGYLRKPFHVIYHRSREEYSDALRRKQPQIESTLGIYFDDQRQSHFFAGEDQDPGTIAHEAVHQFFYESAPKATRNLAVTANAWAVEGVACYFESLTPLGGGAFAIGGPDAGRLQAARHRRVVDNYYVPLAELCALGMTDLQERPDLPRLYSQSAGLASFFIDGEQGRRRDAFRKLLATIYAGRDEPGTLSDAAGVPYEQLDRAYLEFMQSLPVTAVVQP